LTGPGAFWYTDGGAQLLASTAITGTAALDVAQPALSATGTNTQPPITGTAALSVTQPALAGTGTVTAPPITGTAALTVSQPVLAASGTVSVPPITGTGALTVSPPLFSATGTGPGGVSAGGGKHRKHTVNRYPPKRARVHDLGLTVNDLYTGEGSAKVKAPKVSGRGFVEAPGDPEEDSRTLVKMALEDEDLVLAYTMAETWLN